MIILALDTSGSGCSVALTRNRELVAEIHLRNNETHSKHLLGMIGDVMRISGVDAKDVDAFAVTRGPGSFTGLRIGLSTVKGLAVAAGKPLIGVSSLDALAWGIPMSYEKLCVMIDARKDEVFTATYILDDGIPKRITDERLVASGSLCKVETGPALYTGSGALKYKEILRECKGPIADFAAEDFCHISAKTVAELGYNAWQEGGEYNASCLCPVYIRKSDAEINKVNRVQRPAMV
jgi:tRNA threonylcarbamoyladenosine biosynthesis protein TsaB